MCDVKALHLEKIRALKKTLAVTEKAAAMAAEKADSNAKSMTEKHAAELKATQFAMVDALKEATNAREAESALIGELKSLKEQSGHLSTFQAVKVKAEA